MNRESELVVKPVMRWFKRQQVKWKLFTPSHPISTTGFDIAAQRHNQHLLIEAKYIHGPFNTALAGLLVAPLSYRPDRHMRREYRSWATGVCWAIGSRHPLENIYQILFDYFYRNPLFWEHYRKDCKMKYVFFIRNKKVARITFQRLLEISKRYSLCVATKQPLQKRRAVAKNLMAKLRFING